MSLQWSPIEWAVSYKVLYDEETLINPNAPEPILESVSIDKMEIVLPKMLEWTEYYLVVQWLDEKGENIWKTLPLHARTLRNPVFILKDAKVVDDQHLELQFTHSVNLEKTQLEIVNTENKKPRGIKEITLSDDDLRVVHITLEGKMAPDSPHDIVLKKVTDVSGKEMAPESRKNTTILFASLDPITVPDDLTEAEETIMLPWLTKNSVDLIPDNIPTTLPEIQEEPLLQPEESLDDLKQKADDLDIESGELSPSIEDNEEKKTPVIIDTLPNTWSSFLLFFILALILSAYYTHKKITTVL